MTVKINFIVKKVEINIWITNIMKKLNIKIAEISYTTIINIIMDATNYNIVIISSITENISNLLQSLASIFKLSFIIWVAIICFVTITNNLDYDSIMSKAIIKLVASTVIDIMVIIMVSYMNQVIEKSMIINFINSKLKLQVDFNNQYYETY